VRKNMGAVPVPKIDPNTQSPTSEDLSIDNLNTAAIPVLLIGFYKHTRNEQQAEAVMNENDTSKILTVLYGDKKNDILKSVADYSNVLQEGVEKQMERIASAIKRVVENETHGGNGSAVSTFFTNQRSVILKHLPAALNIGEFMNDSSVDDRTNKMEGPMSGLMHTVEKIFSSTK